MVCTVLRKAGPFLRVIVSLVAIFRVSGPLWGAAAKKGLKHVYVGILKCPLVFMRGVNAREFN